MKRLSAYCHQLAPLKLKGAALLSTLVMAIVIMALCTGILLLLYYSKSLHSGADIRQKLHEDLASTTQLILSEAPKEGRDSLSLFPDENSGDSVYFQTIPWGCFFAASVKAKYKNREQDKAFLYGASDMPYADATLYLADFNRPLSLVGDTYINGKAYLPKSGVRAAFLDQQGFTRDKLIDGVIDTSENYLPSLEPQFKAYVHRLVGYTSDKTYPYYPIKADSLTNSFMDKAIIFKAKGNLIIDNQSLTGKIIIISDSSIEVTRTNNLQDILLVAPYIKLREGFSGAIQAFATDSISVESSCHLQYPSALVVNGGDSSKTGSIIRIQSQSQIDGCIIAQSEKNAPAPKPVIKLEKGTTVNGLLYNEGYITLEGKVAGSVFTNFFLQKNQSLTMENTLLNASITASKWVQSGNYFSIFSGGNQQKIVRWLY